MQVSARASIKRGPSLHVTLLRLLQRRLMNVAHNKLQQWHISAQIKH